MAEQLANLLSTTLSAPYTSGSGTMSITNATGFPPSGTYTVAILDGSPLTIVLLFRVTSRSGTTLTGAAEGTDSSAASGSTVLGTILSAAAVAQIETDAGGGGGGGFIQPLTAPSSGALSQFNFSVGSGVTSTQTNNSSPVVSITLEQDDPSVTQNIAAIGKAKIAGTFTFTVALSAMTMPQNFAGLWLSDGTKNIIFGVQGNNGLRVSLFTDFTTFSSDIIAVATFVYNGPLMFLRIQETGSNRFYFLSSDGINFILIFTESNTAHFTTTDYGFCAEVRNTGTPAQVTCYSLTESNP